MFPFKEMNPKSRIWIYQADRKLSSEQQQLIKERLDQFTSQWQAHMKQLLAQSDIIYDQFILISVDEEQAKATGCSIDSSVHLIMEIEKEFNISLLNRMLLTYRDNGNQIKVISRSEFRQALIDGKIDDQTIVFDNTIEFVKDLEKWELPVERSWHSEAFSTS